MDVTIILNLHRERTLAWPTLRSVAAAVSYAQDRGVGVEVLAVLDRPDDATTRLVDDATAPGGLLSVAAQATKLVVDVGDLGLARNAAVAVAQAGVVGTMDADNVMSESWIHDAFRTVCEHDELCVVHPELYVHFGADVIRRPVLSSTDPNSRDWGLVEFNVWDAFSMARREVYERFPYAPTRSGAIGPEDWFWDCELLDSGIPHLVVPDSIFFYRLKGAESLSSAHLASLLPPTAFLRSRERALRAVREVAAQQFDEPAAPVDMVARVDEYGMTGLAATARERDGYVDVEALARQGVHEQHLRELARDRFNAGHYRMLNLDLGELTYEQLLMHWLESGRAAGRRALLSEEEWAALRNARFDADDYRHLNPDLDGLPAWVLVHHFLMLGRGENRRAHRTPATRARDERGHSDKVLAEWRAAHGFEPAVPYPSARTLRTLPWLWPNALLVEHHLAGAYWSVIAHLPETIDALFVVRSADASDADVARQAAASLLATHPDWSVVVLTTQSLGDTAGWPAGATMVDFAGAIAPFRRGPWGQAKVLGSVCVQFTPRFVHIADDSLGLTTMEIFGKGIGAYTQVFMEAPGIVRDADGALSHPILRRRSDFFEDLAGVVTKAPSLVSELPLITGFAPERMRLVPDERLDAAELYGLA